MKTLSRTLFLLIPISGIAVADDAPGSPPRWYAAVSGSLVYLEKVKISPTTVWNSYDFGYGYSVATGFRILPDVRWELEVSDRESTIKHSSLSLVASPGFTFKPDESTAIMTNAYYDFHNASRFVPYLGAGIGDAYIRTPIYSMTTGKLNGWELSYQFMTGVSYEFTDSIAMNLGYRYFTGQDVRINAGGESFHNTSNNIEAGLRMFFN